MGQGRTALAQAPANVKAEPGTSLFSMVRMPVGRDTHVEVHAPVRERVVEAVIRGLSTDLNSVLTGRTNPYVAAMDVVYVGGGTWIIKAMMKKSAWDLRIKDTGCGCNRAATRREIWGIGPEIFHRHTVIHIL